MFSGAVLILLSLLPGIAAFASPPQSSITLDLSGLTFQSGLSQMVSSSPEALIDARFYTYKIQGTMHSTGLLFSALIPNSPSTPIATALNRIEPGLGGATQGVVKNPLGFPEQLIDQSVSENFGFAHISFHFAAEVDAAGYADCSLTNVSIATPFGNDTSDTLVFDPGTTLTITAIPLAVGSYDGLVTTGGTNVGFLKGTVGANGTFTGRLNLDAAVYPVKGSFVLSGSASFSANIPRGQQPLTVSLQSSVQSGLGTITGQISGDPSGLTVVALECPFTVANPSLQAGRYTALLPPPDPNDATLPGGTGYAGIIVGAAGSVTVSGKLGDGTIWTASGLAKSDGSFSVYSPLYGKTLATQGSISGVIAIQGTGSQSTLEGSLSWEKPLQANQQALYSAGFQTNVTLGGSFYATPRVATLADTLPAPLQDATITADGGNLSAELTGTMTVNSASKVTVQAPAADKLTIAISPRTGLFSGSFVDPHSLKQRRYQGAFLQVQEEGGGVFVGETETGNMDIEPVP